MRLLIDNVGLSTIGCGNLALFDGGCAPVRRRARRFDERGSIVNVLRSGNGLGHPC